MNTETATRGVEKILRGRGGQIFGATFVKADGSVRTGTFRLGVKKGVKGVGLGYDRYKAGNLIVYDMAKQAHRTIKLDRLLQLKFRGLTLTKGRDF